MFENKIVVVSGASRGLGQAVAGEFAKLGAIVIGTATTESGAEKVGSFLREFNHRSQSHVLDLSDKQSIDTFAKALADVKEMPDILINNAGITDDDLFLRMEDSAWLKVLETNLSGSYFMMSRFVRHMFRKRWGRVINIGSIVGTTGNLGQANYSAAKAGLIGLTKSVAAEVASRGVTVNVVAPGFIDTDMTRALPEGTREALTKQIPARKLGRPEDVVGAVRFLASDAANYITGQTIHVNGGMFMA